MTFCETHNGTWVREQHLPPGCIRYIFRFPDFAVVYQSPRYTLLDQSVRGPLCECTTLGNGTIHDPQHGAQNDSTQRVLAMIAEEQSPMPTSRILFKSSEAIVTFPSAANDNVPTNFLVEHCGSKELPRIRTGVTDYVTGGQAFACQLHVYQPKKIMLMTQRSFKITPQLFSLLR